MRLMNSLIIALSTYSRLPMPQVEWNDENRRYSMCFFPLVGVVIGLLGALWLWACDALKLGGVLRGAVGAALPLLVSGGIHMDGFLDVSDALASCQAREKKLEILKDSHVGAFAVLNCGLYLLATAGLWSEARLSDAPALAACFVLSRALSAWAATILRGARQGGMLDGFARAAQKRSVSISGLVYAGICATVWIASRSWMGALCLDVAAVMLLIYRRMAYREFGGVTGDLAGWFVQMTELCLLVTVILGGKIV